MGPEFHSSSLIKIFCGSANKLIRVSCVPVLSGSYGQGKYPRGKFAQTLCVRHLRPNQPIRPLTAVNMPKDIWLEKRKMIATVNFMEDGAVIGFCALD